MSELPALHDVLVLAMVLGAMLLLSPLVLLDKLVQRIAQLAGLCPALPTVLPSSYTPLPPNLISPPLSVAYEHRFVTTPSSRVHYVATRPPSPSSPTPPPVLFVHGFPDWWYVWRHQLAHFAATRQCLALDMRGFGYSEVAGDKDDAAKYTSALQCGDIVAVLDKERIDRCFLVGFDWGGMAAWEFARRYPARLCGVASLCTPFRPRREWRLPLPVVVRLAPHWLYQLYFVYCRSQAALELSSDPGRFFSLAIRSQRAVDKLSPPIVLSTLVAWPYLPRRLPPTSLLSAEEQRQQAAMYAWSGFRYPLLWYANYTRNSRNARKSNAELGLPAAALTSPSTERLAERVDVPALMLLADSDRILQPVLSDGMERWCKQLTKVTVRRAGHWALLEQPEQVNEALERWMAAVAEGDEAK